jgi:hypothetical protein
MTNVAQRQRLPPRAGKFYWTHAHACQNRSAVTESRPVRRGHLSRHRTGCGISDRTEREQGSAEEAFIDPDSADSRDQLRELILQSARNPPTDVATATPVSRRCPVFWTGQRSSAKILMRG